MHVIDWAVLLVFLSYVVWDGARRGRNSKDAADYFLAGRKVHWIALGLSIMATQASAITLLSTTGHGYLEGLRFLHVYLALPFAVIILCVTVVPWFMKARLFTAYEYLEHRFDGHTRTLAGLMYLVSRGLVVGPILYAPSVVLALMLGIQEWQAILLMGGLSILYTVVGGMAAVIFTDVKQMIVMLIGIVACFVIALNRLPEGLGLGGALDLAGVCNKLEAVVVPETGREVLAEKYNLLSALFGGLFLFLGYFGADQSQVQRFLSGQSVRQGRQGLFLLAFAKVPMQFIILLLGSLLFVHYTFHRPPVMFREAELEERLEAQGAAGADLRERYSDLQGRFADVWEQRRLAAEAYLAVPDREQAPLVELQRHSEELMDLQQEGVRLFAEAGGEDGASDANHIFPHFLLSELPPGLLGLIIAAVFAAAMSSLDSALSSLATSSVMDFYARWRRRPLEGRDLVVAGRWATLFWGLVGIAAAFVLNKGPMIEVVNRIGSMVYGPLFGIFILGRILPAARGAVGWISLAGGFGFVLFTHLVVNSETRRVEFLWYNLIGFLGVMVWGFAATAVSRWRGAGGGPDPS